jgi:hypothetical protein
MPQATEHKPHTQSSIHDGADLPTIAIGSQNSTAKLLAIPNAAPTSGARATNKKRSQIILFVS